MDGFSHRGRFKPNEIRKKYKHLSLGQTNKGWKEILYRFRAWETREIFITRWKKLGVGKK